MTGKTLYRFVSGDHLPLLQVSYKESSRTDANEKRLELRGSGLLDCVNHGETVKFTPLQNLVYGTEGYWFESSGVYFLLWGQATLEAAFGLDWTANHPVHTSCEAPRTAYQPDFFLGGFIARMAGSCGDSYLTGLLHDRRCVCTRVSGLRHTGVTQ